MTISEAQRFELQLGLRTTLGDDVANSLTEHLPPSGWSDVARAGDIDRFDARFDRLEADMKEGFQSIRSSMRVMVGSFVAVSVGIIVMLVQLNETISRF